MSKPKKNTRTITGIYKANVGKITSSGFVLKLKGTTPNGLPIEIHLVIPWGDPSW